MSSLDLLENNVVFGEGSLYDISKIISEKKYKNLLLITGKNSFALSGADTFFESLREKITINHFSYSGNALDTDTVNSLLKKIKLREEIDLIIGIGGGSVLDLTKLLSLLYSNALDNTNILITEKTFENQIDLILIPTTSGSGSEATNFAVVYKNDIKYSVSSDKFNVIKIILDPFLLKNIPDQILKISILDSLSQAIESYWSINSNDLSKSYAKSALEILAKNLVSERKYDSIDDYLLASHLSGKAINISKTTAPHALSYFLSAHYSIPHGYAVAFFLLEMIKFNYEVVENNCSDVRGSKYVKNSIDEILKIFGFDEILQMQDLVFALLIDVSEELPIEMKNISKLDIINNMVKYTNVERLANNPRTITNEELEKIISISFERFLEN